jgi:hypothetical protein
MKKIILIVISISSMLLAADVTLSIVNVVDDGSGNVTFDVNMNNSSAVAGIQFDVLSNDALIFTGGSGGTVGASGYMITVSASGRVLAFSMSGAEIDPGDAVLINLEATYADSENPPMEINLDFCVEDCDGAISDGDANSLDVETTAASFLDNGDEISLIEFSLNENYPNPFNPSTTIGYSIANPSNVEIVVYDMMGREINSLFSGYQESAGHYSVVWNGFTDDGLEASAGVYIYKMTAGDFTQTSKMLLVK